MSNKDYHGNSLSSDSQREGKESEPDDMLLKIACKLEVSLSAFFWF